MSGALLWINESRYTRSSSSKPLMSDHSNAGSMHRAESKPSSIGRSIDTSLAHWPRGNLGKQPYWWRANRNRPSTCHEFGRRWGKLFAHFEFNPNGTKYVQFRDADGTLLPFSPYYDFNSLTLERAFLRLRRGQHTVCEVTEIKAMTGTCAPASPDTTWTVYDFVTDARIVG